MNTTLNQQQLSELRCESKLLLGIWRTFYPQMSMEEFFMRYMEDKLPKIKDGEQECMTKI